MPKVLLADDNITIHKVVELVLPEGFELRSANNGEEALALVRSFKPDVVLADVEMPSMDGYQLCEEIKRDPATAFIPVVLLAGAYEAVDEDMARRAGADGLLVKPFESDELRRKLDEVLGIRAVEEAALPEEIVLAEDITEDEAFGEEKMWEALGETPLETLAEESLFEETPFGEIPVVEIQGEAPFEERVVSGFEPVMPAMPAMSAGKPAMPAPVFDELKVMAALKESIDKKAEEFFGRVDFKAIIMEAGLKESLESVLWEVVPDLTEKLVKEALTDTMAALKRQLENVIWETVPELAETIIKKEIEKIKSESV